MSHSIRLVAASALVLSFAWAAQAAPVRFAVVGDYGQTSNSLAVANRINALAPDFMATVGDNTYNTSPTTANWDGAVGQYYKSYIKLPAASAFAAQGSPVNKFFPAMGNHDWDVGNSSASFTGYFDLPGNERYYTTTQGNVQLFVLSSDPRDPDGVTVGSTQYNWFVNAISQSTARWQVVTFHHPFQTSTTSSHAPSAYMNWGFQNLGVDLVMQGHNHTMERINFGGIPWVVTGAGGQSHYQFTNTAPGSQFRNSTDYGFSMVTADEFTLTHQFINAAGVVLDTYTIPAPGAAALLALGALGAARRRR